VADIAVDHRDFNDELLPQEVLPDTLQCTIETQKNESSVYHQYFSELPSYTLNDLSTLSDLCNAPAQHQPNEESEAPPQPWWATYL
jgi:hypothetical protein